MLSKKEILMGRTMKTKKRSSSLAVILFGIFKVRTSITILILLLLSVVLMVTLTLMLFISSKNVKSFLINFQYGVLIFNNVFLILYILLIVIKIFSQEFADGTYLLLISKPYSRFRILILKLISIWFLIVSFIGWNVLSSLIAGYIANAIAVNTSYLIILKDLLYKLFLYSLMIAFFASSGIILAAVFLNSQAVLLIVIIFCSLFLIGGMPYSLIMNISNNIVLNFENVTQDYTVQNIKNALIFKDKVAVGNVKYPNITKAIYDFYMTKDLGTISAIKDNSASDDVKLARLNFYHTKFDLTEQKVLSNLIGTDVLAWKGDYRGKPVGDFLNVIYAQAKTACLEVTLHNNYSFKTISNLSLTNKYHQEFSALIHDYQEIIDWNTYYNLRLFYFNSLFLLDKQHSTISFFAESDGPDPNLAESFPTGVEVFQNFYEQDLGTAVPYYKINDLKFISTYESFFENPVTYVIQEFESDILQKVYDYKLIAAAKLKDNKNFQKYLSLANVYHIISKFNLIEHWNQIWTTTLKFEPYQFEPLENSNINFDDQKNMLMSYGDFPLTLNADQHLNLKPTPFLNIILIRNIYLIIAVVFILLASVKLHHKNII